MRRTRINDQSPSVTGLSRDLASPGQRIGAYLVDVLLSIVTLGIYGIVFLIMAHFGSSVGKRMFGIKVVKADGGQPGCITGVLLREIIGRFISSFTFMLGYIWIILDDKRQGWHDKIAETYVIQDRPLSLEEVLKWFKDFINYPLVQWLGLMAVMTIGIVVVNISALREFPDQFNVGRDIGLWIDDRISWMTRNLDFIFDSVKWVVTEVFEPLESFLNWLPWPVFIVAVGVISWKLVGQKMTAFSTIALFMLLAFGLWESTMETSALMIMTVALCVLIAVPIGILASQSDRLDAVLRPILDGMQTMPSFVYLVPAIAFFSLGNPPAVIATLIYAVPPAIRFTSLGIRQVPEETIEATESFGATSWQMMFKVKIPLAMPTIMAGVNQTILMALAMVVIASLVGASGLGEDVLRGLGRLEIGNSFLAGLGIVFLAIIIDRNVQAFAKRQQALLGTGGEADA